MGRADAGLCMGNAAICRSFNPLPLAGPLKMPARLKEAPLALQKRRRRICRVGPFAPPR